MYLKTCLLRSMSLTANVPEETNFIQKYLAPLAGEAGLGLKDDAASFTPRSGMDLVLTADTIVQGTHFLASDNAFDIAVKAITVNLSDLVAKGAKPVGYLFSLSFPQKPDEAWFGEFAAGLATQIKGQLLGGDITVSHGGPLTISVTAIGEVPTGKMVRRNGAQTDDHIFVGGAIGTKTVGLKCALNPEWAEQTGLTVEDRDELIEEYAAPILPHWAELSAVIQQFASASMDVSDGLAIDLIRLCEASGVGALVEVKLTPFHPIIKQLIENGALTLAEAITGGDDYVPLFTVPDERLAPFLEAAKNLPTTRIGNVMPKEKSVTFLNRDHSSLSLGGRLGYDHFSSNEEKQSK